MNIESIPVGLGSGFIWDKDGHVVTNYHGMAIYTCQADLKCLSHCTYAFNVWYRKMHTILLILGPCAFKYCSRKSPPLFGSVVQGSTGGIRVTLFNQETYPAKLIGFDPDKDVAVLKLDIPDEKAKRLRPVELREGDVGSLLVGQKVWR